MSILPAAAERDLTVEMPKGKRRSCLCGVCPKCRNTLITRTYMERRRANGGALLYKPWEPKPRPPLTADHGWLAGIIDGEGCVKIRRESNRTPSVELIVGMTHKPSIERCREIADSGRVSVRTVRAGRPTALWMWAVYSDNAKNVLWLLLPLLVTKREVAERAVSAGA